MSDPRFARLKKDPRFRKPRKKAQKVVVDERFKSIFEDGGKKGKGKVKGANVDKYGRKLSASHDSDNLRRFYRLQGEEEEDEAPVAPDYARGEGLVESSDEESVHDSESENGEVVLGRDIHKPITIPGDEPDIDLDESQFAELDALAKINAEKAREEEQGAFVDGEQTNRLAVVNLDWDHVKASHLFKIFSSVVSPSKRKSGKGNPKAVKGKVTNVRIYPSEFGMGRLEKERLEGPPKELFKNHDRNDYAEDKPDIVEEDDGNEYDEEALRKYQLERLRYYYAIVTCDTIDVAAHIYSELDGTELERSANLFNLSFVPNGMTFDGEFTDEATQELSGNYKGIDFVTDALRHSKVKMTWDDDDPERNKITRRTLSRKEIEESDFKTYLASSGSSDDGSDIEGPATDKREKMRSLLLGGVDDDNELLPEGWGKSFDKAGEMEITFTPGLSGAKNTTEGGEDETTLQRYLRKQKEKRKTKKTAKANEDQSGKEEKDEFFDEDSDDSEDNEEETAPTAKERNGKKGKAKHAEIKPTPKHIESSAAELELLLASAEPSQEPKHFDMRSVIKAEKASSKKQGKRNKKKVGTKLNEDETQQDFSINVKDERFKALYDDHSFAIDPTNPHFKKTKSMSALLEERAKRQRHKTNPEEEYGRQQVNEGSGRSLKSLVESVKRKSTMTDEGPGKKRKV